MRVIPEYPAKGEPLVRGDPITITVPFSVAGAGIPDGYEFRAQIRSSPDSDLVAEFTVVAGDVDVETEAGDPVTVPGLVLHLAGADSARLHTGFGFDLEQTAPVTRTIFVVEALLMRKDYSHD